MGCGQQIAMAGLAGLTGGLSSAISFTLAEGFTFTAANFAFSWGSFATSLALSTAGRMLNDEDKQAVQEAKGRMQTIRSADQPRRVIYGETMVGGTLVFAATGAFVDIGAPAPVAPPSGNLTFVGLDDTGVMLLQYPSTIISNLTSKVGDTFTVSGHSTTYTITSIAEASDSYKDVVRVSTTPPVTSSPSVGATTTLTASAPNPVGVTTGAGSNSYLYMVIALAGHEVEEIGTVWFGDKPEYDPQFNGNGGIPRFVINRHTGAPGQTADAHLMAAFPDQWTSSHRLDGIAYITVILCWDKDVWQSGIPNCKAVVKGRKLLDPRDGQTRWTNNWALVVRDYLTSENGLSCSSGEIDDTFVIEAANICDEVEALKPASWLFSVADSRLTMTKDSKDMGGGVVEYVSSDTRRLRSGDAVKVSSTGTLPGGLNNTTTYYVIRRGITGDQSIQLTTTFSYAMAGTNPVTITNTGSGTHSITVQSQRRYTADGTFDLSATPQSVLDNLVTAGAGMITCQGGIWKVLAGAWRPITTPDTHTITDDVLAGPVQVRARLPKSDLYNAVRGTYCDPVNQWQASDFSPVNNSTYVTQDNGEVIWHDISLPYTVDSIRAQRIAKILLEKSRQQITVSLTANLKALSIGVGDNVYVKNSSLGWDTLNGGAGKVFTVTSWAFNEAGISLSLQEEASTCYDWDTGDETTIDSAPDTGLQAYWFPSPPTALYAYQKVTRSISVWENTVFIHWTPPDDARVIEYQLEGRVGSQEWAALPTVIGSEASYSGVPAGTYSVRVRSVARNGATSAWATETVTVLDVKTLCSAIGLPPIQSPVLRARIDRDNHVDRLQFSAQWDAGSARIMPDGVLLSYALFDHDNKVKIASGGTGSTLTLESAEILGNGTFTILDGSTRSAIVVATVANPLPSIADAAKHYGMVWASCTGSLARRIIGADATTLYLDAPFNVDPPIGGTLSLGEVAWVDNRADEFRLGYLTDGTSYEIVRWASVQQVSVGGAIQITGCQRGAEGTTPISANGRDFHYYPSFGPGSMTTLFPLHSFTLAGGVYSATADVDIAFKPEQYFTAAACVYAVVDGKLLRSPLVPIDMLGELS